MHLVELIPTASTRPEIIDQLETFLTSVVGKGVVRAKDTPNFIANRVGIFSILAVIAEAEKFGLRFDEVDDLTGARLGRAKSGDVPHGGRGRPRHDGARHQDDAGQPRRTIRSSRSTKRPPCSPGW